MPLPTNRLFILLAVIAVIGLLAAVWPVLTIIWQISLSMLIAIMLIDLVSLYLKQSLEVEREVPGSIPLGVSRMIGLRLHNQSARSQSLTVFDHYPQGMQAKGLPIQVNIAAGQFADVQYALIANERGKFDFQVLQLRLLSLLGLWLRDVKLLLQNETHVYPNFAAISQYALLATDNNLSQMGIIKKRRRGEGQDFHQLREYRECDALRQIDWKATARSMKLISREYQDERDQEVIFMLDCGHRMLTQDGELSHFDHTLNALLLLSYVALRQGDAVGLGTFSGESRWLPPRKGYHTIQNVLNMVYDLQPGTEAPDFSKAATDVLLRHKKRALIVILSNVRDEDNDDLIPAVNLLSKRHLVLVASLREQILDRVLNETVNKFPDAIVKSATHLYLQQRKQAFDRLLNTGITAFETTPNKLSVELINAYLNVKRSGRL